MAAFAKNLLHWTAARFAGSPVDTSAAATTPAPLPAAPTPDLSGEIAAAKRRQRQAGMTAPAKGGTLLTGPSGVETPATTQRSTLLGGS